MAIAFTSSNWVEAQLVAGLLESNGLKVLVLDANLAGVDPLYANAIGRIKVVVPDQQLATAIEILEAFRGGGGLDPRSGSLSGFG